jgi:molybdate transport system ATP-binding protein
VKRRSATAGALQVELKDVWLQRSGRTVLRAIDWRIGAGERWVVLGENGTGKTQLLKLVAGAIWPMPRRATRRLYTWQDEVHDEPRDVGDEIAYLGAERQDRYEHYDWNLRVTRVIGTGLYRTDIPLHPLTRQDRVRIVQLLRLLDIEALASRRLLTLSYGQRRLVLLARALAARPALLLLDEPLNGLDAQRRAQLLQLFARPRLLPTSWALATHRPEDIPRNATHLLRLERGRVTFRGALDNACRRALLQPITTSVPSPVTARRVRRTRAGVAMGIADRSAATAGSAAAAPLIQLRNGWVWLEGKSVLRRLEFSVAAGDCWVVHGPNGGGKSTLVRALYGDLGIAAQGTIRRRGIEAGVPISEFKRRVGLVAPELQTLHPLYLTALETVVSGLHSSIGLDDAPTVAETLRARRSLRRLGATALAARPLRELSYGQMRRVLFARALIAEPDILLLDEPYTGLDAPTRRALLALVESLAEQGTTILMTTHHRDEWPLRVTHELELQAGETRYCGVVRLG